MTLDTLTIGRADERREVVAVPHNGGRFYMWLDRARDLELYPAAWRSLGWEVVA